MRAPLIVIPTLNEEAHLPALLALLLAENAPSRIVVCDGGSRDRTVAITEGFAAQHPQLSLLHNPKRIQSAAINLAVAAFGTGHEWLVRIDAHCDYPHDYVRTLLDSAERHQATSVVVPMVTRGTRCFQRGVAAAQNSVLGTGGSPHRHLGEGRFVDHGHHALFKLALFDAVGGYDESFSHNEDAELDQRLRAIGGRIWLEPAAALVYQPRASAGALLRQYRRYGEGRAKTIAKHRLRLKPRQALPLAIAPLVAIAIAGLILSPLQPWLALAALPALGWAALSQGYALLLAVRQRSLCTAAAGVAAMTMHLGWSLGYWLQRLRARPLPPPHR